MVEGGFGLNPAGDTRLGAHPGRQRTKSAAVARVLAEEAIDRLPLFADPVFVALPQVQGDASIRVELAVTTAGATARHALYAFQA